jgi:hypothetical protein
MLGGRSSIRMRMRNMKNKLKMITFMTEMIEMTEMNEKLGIMVILLSYHYS